VTDAELRAELARIAVKTDAAKRALKTLMGQQRLATQLLAALTDDLVGLERRLERTAEEAQHAQEDHREPAYR
jgi:hypothetical protein